MVHWGFVAAAFIAGVIAGVFFAALLSAAANRGDDQR